jgi:hypothetical protein
MVYNNNYLTISSASGQKKMKRIYHMFVYHNKVRYAIKYGENAQA